MVMMTALPFAVSKPMTTAEIENFVEGSLPNGTIIENVDTGAIAVINAGMPQYLPYAEGIIPDVSDFVTQGEISNLMEKPTANGSVGQVLTRANGSIPYEWADASVGGGSVDTSNLMEKPTANGSVGQVLTRSNGSIPYEWSDVPIGSGSGGGFPQLVSSFAFAHSGQRLNDPIEADYVLSHVRSSDVGSAVLSSDFVEVQLSGNFQASSVDSLNMRDFSVYTSADDVTAVLDNLYKVVMSPSFTSGTPITFDIKSGLLDLRNLSSTWSSLNYCFSGSFGNDKTYRAYSVLNFYKVM